MTGTTPPKLSWVVEGRLQLQWGTILHAVLWARTATSSHLLPALLDCYAATFEGFNSDPLSKSNSNLTQRKYVDKD